MNILPTHNLANVSLSCLFPELFLLSHVLIIICTHILWFRVFSFEFELADEFIFLHKKKLLYVSMYLRLQKYLC